MSKTSVNTQIAHNDYRNYDSTIVAISENTCTLTRRSSRSATIWKFDQAIVAKIKDIIHWFNDRRSKWRVTNVSISNKNDRAKMITIATIVKIIFISRFRFCRWMKMKFILIWKRDLFWFEKRLQIKLKNLVNKTKQDCKWDNRVFELEILIRWVIQSNSYQISDDIQWWWWSEI